EYISKLRSAMELNAQAGSAAGNILRWDWEEGEPGLSNVVDSLGVTELVYGAIQDRGSGRLGLGNDQELKGVSGCLPMYRREAIEESSMNRELFDARYHTYKEDVDLAFRLYSANWMPMIVEGAVAHHRREVRRDSKREHISYASQFHSYRNHLWNLLTHLSVDDMVRRGWAIVPYEIAKMGYLLFMHPTIVWRTLTDTIEYFPELMKKRSWYGARTR
ncbi:hypothetical protein HQ524_01550, partial [Candidatus Uhrbacteria bacterium]|nr:hypothetical protein [Candidatus Uhrbacteria bacterium]